jgi:hypothetical protein
VTEGAKVAAVAFPPPSSDSKNSARPSFGDSLAGSRSECVRVLPLPFSSLDPGLDFINFIVHVGCAGSLPPSQYSKKRRLQKNRFVVGCLSGIRFFSKGSRGKMNLGKRAGYWAAPLAQPSNQSRAHSLSSADNA